MALSPKAKKPLIAGLIIALIAGIYMFMHRGQESTDDAAIEAHIISISPKVPGYVAKLNIDDNQLVHTGDVLMEIDPTDYQIRRDRARANVDAAKAAVSSSTRNVETTRISAPSNLTGAQAQVSAAEANYTRAANDLKRMQKLGDEARSRQQLDEAIAAEQTAKSNLEDARARLLSAQTAPTPIAAAESNEKQLQAQVAQAEADLALAEKELADTKIVASEDGRITRKGAEQGDYVQTGQTLGYIVGSELWVIANFKETQLEHMKPGQKVDIDIDAYPDVHLNAKIGSIQSGSGVRFSAFPPENATGNFVKIVQRVPVKILFDTQADPNLPIGPGMSVTPTVYTH